MHISDVEKQTGLPAKTIRYYESRGLVQVGRKENGYRTYDAAAVEVLCQIRGLRELGISLADIRLWRDGVVTHEELIAKRLRSLDDDTQKSISCRLRCEAILRGEDALSGRTADDFFCEEELTEPIPDCPLLLGVDIGTTSLSAQVVASDSGRCVQTYSFDHSAALAVEGCPDAYAADAARLIDRASALVASLIETYPGIASIGITGQMHGIVCIDCEGNILSPLYTWQNEFGLRSFDGTTVCEEIASLCGETIPTGYGIVTYYALRKMGQLPPQTAKIVTIMDLLVSRLTGKRPLIHPTNAAALGTYDLRTSTFKQDVLGKLGISPSVFPTVTGDYTVAGSYRNNARAIPIAAAIGDNQAGVFGSLADRRMVLVNVGTSSQVSIICNDPNEKGGEVRPYFDGQYLLSGAALCGGRAYAMLKNFIRSILAEFGQNISDRAIYEHLNQITERGFGSDLQVDTRFCGTRTDPTARGSISNIAPPNFTPEALSAGTLRGIVNELYDMYTAMHRDGEEIVTVASGNAMRKNPALCKLCATAFGNAPLIPLHTEEAAFGAALYGGVSAGVLTRAQAYTRIGYRE